METLDALLQTLWEDYIELTPQAKRIHVLLTEREDTIRNDHIAFRTFRSERCGLSVLAHAFLNFGYEEKGEYQFTEKKLYAKHFEHPDMNYPKVFISELRLEEFSKEFQENIQFLVDQVPEECTRRWDFPAIGRPWSPISYTDYLEFKEESEFAAWVASFGFRANHFTISIDDLNSFDKLAAFNDFLKTNDFTLNKSGGEIKGSPQLFLEQSSTLADAVEIDFADGKQMIPSCYYEFAKRYPLADGTLYQGFVAQSADKIFESTDNRAV